MKLIIFDLDGTLLDTSNIMQEKFFAGAFEMLTKLNKQANIHLAIATGKSLRGTKSILSAYNVMDYFTSLQTPDNNKSKPNPEMIFNAIDVVGVNVSDVIMVGDTSLDIKMAQAAGVRSIGVSWGFYSPAQLTQNGADEIVTNFDDLFFKIRATNA